MTDLRSRLMRWLGTGVAAAAIAAGGPALAQGTLKFAPHADLKVVAPITNTAAITLLHSYMIYDTLYAFDDQSRPQPQMVESHSVSADGLVYTFKLRPGQTFHDGSAVTTKDVVASLKRWAARDSNGRAMTAVGATIAAVDDSTFTITLKEKWGLVLDSLAKLSANVAFMMREKEAATDPNTPITETIGSGPFTFEKAEWVPGSKIVYKKFAAYKPRSEPANYYSGGKVAKVDRVEWNYLPDSNTAAAALNAGEVDIYENPTIDLLPILQKNKDIVIAKDAHSRWISYILPNPRHPPIPARRRLHRLRLRPCLHPLDPRCLPPRIVDARSLHLYPRLRFLVLRLSVQIATGWPPPARNGAAWRPSAPEATVACITSSSPYRLEPFSSACTSAATGIQSRSRRSAAIRIATGAARVPTMSTSSRMARTRVYTNASSAGASRKIVAARIRAW